MRVLLVFAAISLTAWGQDVKIERKLIQLKYIDASRASNLAGTFGGQNLNIQADDHLHAIAVRGPAEGVALFEEAVKKLDVAPIGFELTVYLISATSQAGDHLPEALASTAKQLHGVFAYRGYDLLDSFVLRGRDGQGNGSADGTIKNSTYSFRYNHATVLSGPPILVNLQAVNLQVRTPTGTLDDKGNARYKSTGVNTDVDVRDGQKVVVGKSDINNGDNPLILVVTARAVE